FPINIPNEDGYGYIPVDKLRGGGLLISSGTGSAPVVIDSITWTRFCSECDDTQDNFQPLWQAGDLDGTITIPYIKVPYVVSPTRVTGLYTGGNESGTPVAGYSSNIFTSNKEEPDFFIFPGSGQVTYQVYVCDPDDYIVALCVDNPAAGTQVKISARPVRSTAENSFTVTLPQTHSPDGKNFQRLILDENTQGTLHLATGFNYITVAATKLGGSYMFLELIELVNLRAKPLVQAEAAEADSLRANMEWWYGKRGFMVANHRQKVMPRFGPMVPWKENVRDWDITGFVRDVKTMGGQFVNFRALPSPFAGTVQAVEDINPGATPLTWTETNRDFYMDLADALKTEDIKLTLLLGRGGFGGGDAECARQWMYQITKVLNGIGNHYGDKVAGYQFDGGHDNRKSYPRINCKPILVATKTGQVLEDRAAGANWSELTLTDPWQEFTLKEGYGPPDEVMKAPFWTYGDAMWEYGPGEWGVGKGLKSQGGPKITLNGNAHMDQDTPISPLRNTDEVLFPWVRESLKNGGMITSGAEAYQTPYEGSYFSPEQINQMVRLTAYLQKDSVITSSGLYHSGEEWMQVHPNPGNGSFSLELTEIKSSDRIYVYVSDLAGKIIYQANEIAYGERFRKEYNLPDLHKGVYFIAVMINQRKSVKKIIL
ncbi:MAG: T9SS type A sorting domain-containing protein, partial [Bacteroidia bacterium]|nr:T9SS type A sorting domain-containing protein [Bacteroidia bacterium]